MDFLDLGVKKRECLKKTNSTLFQCSCSSTSIWFALCCWCREEGPYCRVHSQGALGPRSGRFPQGPICGNSSYTRLSQRRGRQSYCFVSNHEVITTKSAPPFLDVCLFSRAMTMGRAGFLLENRRECPLT